MKKYKLLLGILILICILLIGCTKKDSNVIQNSTTEETSETQLPEPVSIRLGFAGDMNLDESWATTLYLNEQENGIYDCISPNLMQELQNFDLFMLNNEFTYSDRGSPLPNKLYTFRAKPERVDILKQMGVDLVLLANNHVYDYGNEAFEDTLSTLTSAGIPYVGAGRNVEEASNILYYTYENTTISYVAATRAEKYIMTPEADENSPGVVRTYDSTRFLELVREAKANSDYCIANVHWGTEDSHNVVGYQTDLGHALIDAGADAVIGTHPHVLQGIELYNGKPIAYSLGNFWFNDEDMYTGVLELTLDVTNSALTGIRFLPCTQYNCYTNYPTDFAGKQEILEFMESISFSVTFDENGNVENLVVPE